MTREHTRRHRRHLVGLPSPDGPDGSTCPPWCALHDDVGEGVRLHAGGHVRARVDVGSTRSPQAVTIDLSLSQAERDGELDPQLNVHLSTGSGDGYSDLMTTTAEGAQTLADAIMATLATARP